MAAPTVKVALGWSGLGLGLRRVALWLPGLVQVRWSRYGPEYQDPQTDKEYYRKPLAQLTEEETYERELRKTQVIKAAPATKTCSVFEDPVISKFTNMMMKGGNKILARSLMTQVNSTSLCHLCFPHSFVFGSFILRQKTMDSVPVIESTEFLCIYVWEWRL